VSKSALQRKAFEDELARIVRRANRLRAAMDGSADIVATPVNRCVVAKHERAAHTRYIIKRRKSK
jgi:hypothetical protein